MGIAREDKEKRMEWMMRGFRQFDAPVSLVLTYDKSLEPAGITQFGLGVLNWEYVKYNMKVIIKENKAKKTFVLEKSFFILKFQEIKFCYH